MSFRSFLEKTMRATQAGWQAFHRVYSEPSRQEVLDQAFQQRCNAYALLWAYYNGSMFEGIWRPYIANYNLYRNVRLIYNKSPKLVEFYVAQIYPGVLSEDGQALPDGVQLAVPFTKDTKPELKAAIAQIWKWSNWRSKKSLQIRYGSALGSVLCEVVDDVQRRKVHTEVVWPGRVKEIDLDSAGNVISYCLEYPVRDITGAYVYRKEVTKESISYYRDDRLYDYGNGSQIDNPYGFTPAVWVRHRDVGSIHGESAIAGLLGKIDEVNDLASHTYDHIHIVVDAPAVLWGGGSINNLTDIAKRPSRDEVGSNDSSAYEGEEIKFIKGPMGGHVESLAGDLNIADANATIDRVNDEIKSDHPELNYYDALRSMTTVTGPGAQRLLGDVAALVGEAGGMYDDANISLWRMAVAIAGFRAQSGAWGPIRSLTRQQQKFLPYNLESFARGDLDMDIAPRSLVVPTNLEKSQEQQAFWQAINSAVQAGVPLEVALEANGWTKDQITKVNDTRAQQIQNDQLVAQEDAIPPVGQ